MKKISLLINLIFLCSAFSFAQEAKAIPTFEFEGGGIKIEAENMRLEGFNTDDEESIFYIDKDASGKKSVAVPPSASDRSASVKVIIKEGTYELLAAEKAFQNANAVFKISAKGTKENNEEGLSLSGAFYPSNPPLGYYELTTRSPITFTLKEKQEIVFTLYFPKEKNQGLKPTYLDYIQIVKISK